MESQWKANETPMEGRRAYEAGRGLRVRREVLWRDLLEAVLSEEVGRVVPKLFGVLDEGPAVDVAHVAAPVRAKQVEAAERLTKRQDDCARDRLLGRRQDDRVAYLAAARVAHHLAIDDGRLARLRVRVLAADGVHLDVGALGLPRKALEWRSGMDASNQKQSEAIRSSQKVVTCSSSS